MPELTKKQKIVAASVLVVCGVFGVLIIFFIGSARLPERRAADDQYSALPAESSDADEDGLTDEEEREIGTNPQHPDSDLDGYMDGEEVAQNTDPLQKTSLPEGPSLKDIVAGNIDASQSQQFIGALLTDISDNDRLYFTASTSTDEVKMHLSYKPEDIEVLSEKMAEAFAQLPDIASAVQRPEDAELTISDNNSPGAVQAYLTALITIVSEPEAVKDMRALFDAVGTEQFLQNGALPPDIKSVAKTRIAPSLSLMEKKLRALVIPSVWKELHKDEIAIIASERLAVSYLVEPAVDAARSLYALAILDKAIENWGAWKERATELVNS